MGQMVSYIRMDGSQYDANMVPDDVDASYIERLAQAAYDRGRADQAEHHQALVSASLAEISDNNIQRRISVGAERAAPTGDKPHD